VRWVAPRAMHLTLAFLGDIRAAQVPSLQAALDHALAGQVAPQLQLTMLGAFPNQRRPRVVWVGVGGTLDALMHIANAVSTALETLGWPVDPRPFQPHLTLGRLVRDADLLQQARLARILTASEPLPPTSWSPDQVVVFRSEVLPTGPRYTAQVRVQLLLADASSS